MKVFCRRSRIHRSQLCILLVTVTVIIMSLIKHIRIDFVPLCTRIVADSMIPAIAFTYHLFDMKHDRFNTDFLKDALTVFRSYMIPPPYVMESVLIHDESEFGITSNFRLEKQRHLISNETNSSDDGTSKMYILFVVIAVIASWVLFYYVYCGTCPICVLFTCGRTSTTVNGPSRAALQAAERSRRLQHILNERMERGHENNNNSNNNDTINHPIIISMQEFDSLPTFNYKINDNKVETTNAYSSEDAAIRMSMEGDADKEDHDSTIIQVKVDDQVKNSCNNVTNEICSICVEDFQSMERVVMLPQCLHVYHIKCIEQWLVEKKSNFCPLCKTKVFLPNNIIETT